MIATNNSYATRINRQLTSRLCGQDGGFTLEHTIPYKELVENEELPFTKS